MTPRNLLRLAAGLGLLLVAGCVGADQARPGRVDIAPGVVLRLPEAPPFGPRATATQLVQATYGDRAVALQAYVESDAGRTLVVMTLPSGPRIMTVEWTATAFTARLEPQAPPGLTGEHLLADMMLIYAPLALVQAALEGGDIGQAPDGTRLVTRDGAPLITISRLPDDPALNPWNGPARLDNVGYGYSLTIDSQSSVP